MIISKSTNIGGKTLTIETGKMAKQADGAVTVRYGDTLVLITVVAAEKRSDHLDFFPLSVEYREKMFSAGKIPGGFIKREGRPSEKEILSARLIDRPIRPLFPDNFKYETQVIVNVLSLDKENDPDVLAGLGSSAALVISNIPFDGPIATVRVVKVDGAYLINPVVEEIEKAELELVVAGSDESIMMVEGEAEEVSEETLLEAIEAAHDAIKKLTALQREIISELDVEKRVEEDVQLPEGLEAKVKTKADADLDKAVRIQEKSERRKAIRTIYDEINEELAEEYPECEKIIGSIIHDVEKDKVRAMILDDSIRLDGRGTKDIREITGEVGLLPRTHGSALFTRGQTQALGVVTLGSKSDEQIIDAPEGESKKRYTLHYNFPPFCVGEARPIRGVSRREIGHGNLAERALKPVVPESEKFPYTIRIVSEVLESNGSSSMASVCAGSLSMMDAGIPIESGVAGIAMGLIKEGDKVAILSDILGDEDHLGDMDFKVAGTNKGITAVQMDIKINGISKEIMTEALAQAGEGRAHIMGKMNEVISGPRTDINRFAPRIIEFKIAIDKIGTVIGPGGKSIRAIIEETGVDINIADDGTVTIASVEADAADKAINIIKSMVEEPEVGKAYSGVVKRIRDFGAFVEILPGKDGMVHISELELTRTKNVTDVIKEGDVIDVIVKSVGNDGKVALSRRMFLEKQNEKNGESTDKK